jgi:hypothetical protein
MRKAVVKRRKVSSSSTDPKNANTHAEADNASDLLRKFFESQFQPLDIPTNPTTTSRISDEDEEDESGEDFEGFSENESESEEEVMVVEHVDARREDKLLDKQTRKALLVRFLSGMLLCYFITDKSIVYSLPKSQHLQRHQPAPINKKINPKARRVIMKRKIYKTILHYSVY